MEAEKGKGSEDRKVRYFMLVDARSGKWSFPDNNLDVKEGGSALRFIRDLLTRSNKSQCTYVESMPMKSVLEEKGYELYGDDTGMYKGLVMNVCFNPLCTDAQIINLASFGGPFGSLVLHNEKGIDLEYLSAMVKKYDKKLEDEGEEDPGYHEMFVKAIAKIGQ